MERRRRLAKYGFMCNCELCKKELELLQNKSQVNQEVGGGDDEEEEEGEVVKKKKCNT